MNVQMRVYIRIGKFFEFPENISPRKKNIIVKI